MKQVKVGGRQMGFVGELWSRFENFAQGKGVSPIAAAGFAALVVLGMLLLVYSTFFSSSQFKVTVYSASSPVQGASVELVSLEGRVLAQAATDEQGVASFNERFSASKVSVRASKPGLYSAEGTYQAALLVDLSKRKNVSIDLFAEKQQPSQQFSGVEFTVLDKYSRNPVAGASLQASLAAKGNLVPLAPSASGNFFVNASQGTRIRLRASAPNYYPDERTVDALNSSQAILLSPRLAGQFSFSKGELPRVEQGMQLNSSEQGVLPDNEAFFLPKAVVKARNSKGAEISSGNVCVVTSSGEKIYCAQISSGQAELAVPFQEGFSLQVDGAAQGTVELSENGSARPLLSLQLFGGSASLSPKGISSLAVSVQAQDGSSLSGAKVTAFDNATGAPLAEAIVLNGLAVFGGGDSPRDGASIAVGTSLRIALFAQGYFAQQESAVFGTTASVSILAKKVNSSKETVFRAFNSLDGSPANALVRVFRQGEQIPAAQFSISGNGGLELQEGITYSAVYSSPGKYSVVTADFQSGSSVEAEMAGDNSPASVQACVSLQNSRECVTHSFTPGNLFSLLVTVQDTSGTAIEGATVSLKDSRARPLFVQRAGQDGNAQFSQIPAGTYALAACASGFCSSKQVQVSSSSEQTLQLRPTATILAQAKTISGQPVALANFSIAGAGVSCSGASSGICSLSVDANKELKVIVSAPGFAPATAERRLVPWQVSHLSFVLSPADSPATVSFLGVRDALGRPASSLLSGQDYFLQFAFFSPAQESTSLVLRAGELQQVSKEQFGILDFLPPQGALLSKSITYSQALAPPVACSFDLNNNSPENGLLKWVSLGFENKGASMQKIVSIPVRLKATASAATSPLKFFYRLEGKSGNFVERIPLDAQLGTAISSQNSCYAQSLETSLPLASAGGACNIGGIEFAHGTCLASKPLKCENGVEVTDALSCGCPAGKIAGENGSCSSIACEDGTPLGQCSAVPQNSLKKCSSASPTDSSQALLQSSSECTCASGTRLQANSCIACTASDCGLPPTSTCTSPAGFGARVSPGCIRGFEPSLCTSSSEVVSSPAQCGCGQAKEFNLPSGACVSSNAAFACSDGTAPGKCSSQKPRKCILSGGSSLLISAPFECGCPTGSVFDGVECHSTQVITPTPAAQAITPTPSPTGGITPTTAPAPTGLPPGVECTAPSTCLQDGSEEYCTSTGKSSFSCLRCNPECGGNPALFCNPATDTCQQRSCVDAFRRATPVGSCSQFDQPKRCELLDAGPTLVNFASRCGCQQGFKPSTNGRDCIACVSGDCEGEITRACTDAQGNSHSAEQCLPETLSFASQTGAEPVKKCLAAGSIVPSIGECGCPAPYRRSFDGSRCVPDPAISANATARERELPANSTCANCVASDEIFFNQVTGKLATASTKLVYQMQADTFFPADAFKLVVRGNSSSFRISPQGITSNASTAGCYAYDLPTSVFSFRLSNSCPIIVLGNKFFHSGSNEYVDSDEVTLTLRHETVPPQDLRLTMRLSLKNMESLRVQPIASAGPSTSQLIYLINNKQTIFGPRPLKVYAQTQANDQMAGAGVKVLAWRGPGALSIKEEEDTFKETISTHSYIAVPSYFTCAGETGPRIESCGGDPFCCAGGWCNGQAFGKMMADFAQYARNTAQLTAFRRGIDSSGKAQPFATIAGLPSSEPGNANKPFELFTAAQVIDGSQNIVRASGITLSVFNNCSNNKRPGVYSIRASTIDGRNFSFDAQNAYLEKHDYVDGTCGDDSLFTSDPKLARPDLKAQPLCDFLYGDCSCVERSKHSVFASIGQNKDAKSTMDALALLGMIAPLLQQAGGLGGLGGLGGAAQGLFGPAGACSEGGACTAGGCNTGGNVAKPQIAGQEGASQSAGAPVGAAASGGIRDLFGSGGPGFGGCGPGGCAKPEVTESISFSSFGAVSSTRGLSSISLQGAVGNPLACRLAQEAGGKGTTLNTRFEAEEFKSQCESLSGSYKGARKDTDQFCGSPMVPIRAAGLPLWVDQPIAHHHIESSGVAGCGLFCSPLPCTTHSDFEMTEDRNKGEIIRELDKCEDEDHSPPPGTVLSTHCQQRVNQVIIDVSIRVKKDIKRALSECNEKCTANRKLVCCGYCTADIPCIVECIATAASAKAQFESRLDTCRNAVQQEINTGSQCEATAKQLVEVSGSSLQPGPPNRHAWATCNALGVTKHSSSEGGQCVAITQEKYPFVHVGVEGDAISKYARSGEKFDSTTRAPALGYVLNALDTNRMFAFAAGSAYAAGAPGAFTQAQGRLGFSPYIPVSFAASYSTAPPASEFARATQQIARASQTGQNKDLRALDSIQQAVMGLAHLGATPFDTGPSGQPGGSGMLAVFDNQNPAVQALAVDDTCPIPDKLVPRSAMEQRARTDITCPNGEASFVATHKFPQTGCGCGAGFAGKSGTLSFAPGCGCPNEPPDTLDKAAKESDIAEKQLGNANAQNSACGAGGCKGGPGGCGGAGCGGSGGAGGAAGAQGAAQASQLLNSILQPLMQAATAGAPPGRVGKTLKLGETCSVSFSSPSTGVCPANSVCHSFGATSKCVVQCEGVGFESDLQCEQVSSNALHVCVDGACV